MNNLLQEKSLFVSLILGRFCLDGKLEIYVPMNKAARCQLQTLVFLHFKGHYMAFCRLFFNVQFSSIWILIFQLLLLMSFLDDHFFFQQLMHPLVYNWLLTEKFAW